MKQWCALYVFLYSYSVNSPQLIGSIYTHSPHRPSCNNPNVIICHICGESTKTFPKFVMSLLGFLGRYLRYLRYLSASSLNNALNNVTIFVLAALNILFLVNDCTEEAVGDEMHFLLGCSKFASERGRLFYDLKPLYGPRNSGDFLTFNLLMRYGYGDTHMAGKMLKYVSECFNT